MGLHLCAGLLKLSLMCGARVIRSSLERLEDRFAPANLTVAVHGHTLSITGDLNDNTVHLSSVANDVTKFVVGTADADTINNQSDPYFSPAGIKNISISLGEGADTVQNSNDLTILGSVTIHGGNGANAVIFGHVNVGKNLTIINGSATSAAIATTLQKMEVGGKLTVTSAGGDTEFYLGESVIKESVAVHNGAGEDQNQVDHVNVGGNMTLNNGHGSSLGVAGFTAMVSHDNPNSIAGNLTLTYLDGNQTASKTDTLEDLVVGGNLAIHHGTGKFQMEIDGVVLAAPVEVAGSVTIDGTGANSILVGYANQHAGMVVGKNFTVQLGAGADVFFLEELKVRGTTTLALGDGDNSLTLDDSYFGGAVQMTSGNGADVFKIETENVNEANAATTFAKAVVISAGAGNDQFTLAGTDSGEEVVGFAAFTIHHGTGTDTPTFITAQIDLPFSEETGLFAPVAYLV